MMIDEKGRLFGKVSILDMIIVMAVIGLALGFVYRRAAPGVQQILQTDSVFYVTFVLEGVRDFTTNAVDTGDVFFRQHDRQPLGSVIRTDVKPATDILYKTDGTAVLAEVEGRYDLYLTLECRGSITDTGYYVNGSQQMAEGGRMRIQSNRILSGAMVYSVDESI